MAKGSLFNYLVEKDQPLLILGSGLSTPYRNQGHIVGSGNFFFLFCTSHLLGECELMRFAKLKLCNTEEATPPQVLYLCGELDDKYTTFVWTQH